MRCDREEGRDRDRERGMRGYRYMRGEREKDERNEREEDCGGER
jgi:hypothetical protein